MGVNIPAKSFPTGLQQYAGMAAKKGGKQKNIDSSKEVDRVKNMVKDFDPGKTQELNKFLAAQGVNATSGISGKVRINQVWDWGKGSNPSKMGNTLYISGVPGDANGAHVIFADRVKAGQSLKVTVSNDGGAMWYGPTGIQIELSGDKNGESFQPIPANEHLFVLENGISLAKVKVSPDFNGSIAFEVE